MINNKKENVATMSTDTKAITKIFPALTGIESAEWEQIKLGSDLSGLPGPSDYIYQGYIILTQEASDNYFELYSWTSETPDVNMEIIHPVDGKWYYSEEFTKDIIPENLYGNIWFDKRRMLFSVSTT